MITDNRRNVVKNATVAIIATAAVALGKTTETAAQVPEPDALRALRCEASGDESGMLLPCTAVPSTALWLDYAWGGITYAATIDPETGEFGPPRLVASVETTEDATT